MPLIPSGGFVSGRVYYRDEECKTDPMITEVNLVVATEDQVENQEYFVAESAELIRLGVDEYKEWFYWSRNRCKKNKTPNLLLYKATPIELGSVAQKGPYQLGNSAIQLAPVAPPDYIDDGHGHAHP